MNLARYYTVCDREQTSPFTENLTRAMQSAGRVLTALSEVKQQTHDTYPRHIVSVQRDDFFYPIFFWGGVIFYVLRIYIYKCVMRPTTPTPGIS